MPMPLGWGPAQRIQPMDHKLIARFWSKVDKDGPIHPILKTRCWMWTGSTSKLGYGRFWMERSIQLAHRVSWYLSLGSWPTPDALHKCDIRRCVRPEHLWEGNNRDNCLDMHSKGRAYKKLRKADVLAIREGYRPGKVTQKELARRFKVTQAHISAIVLNQTRRVG
jgi:hypothetical protein